MSFMKNKSRRVCTLTVALVLALMLASASLTVRPGQPLVYARASAAEEKQRPDRMLPAGIAVGGMPVGGLGANAAIANIRAKIDEALAGKVSLEVDDEKRSAPKEAVPVQTATWAELGLMLSADEAVTAIERYRDAKWPHRREALRALRRSYGLVAAWDEERFAEQAEALWGERAERLPVDAVRSINAYDAVVYAPEQPGTALDIAALLAAFEARAPAGLTGAAHGTADDAAPPSVRLHMMLPVVPVLPEITVASLRAEGITRKIAQFSTSFAASGEGRAHNVTVTAQALDGTLLEPGATFDYEAIVAKARRQAGYLAAPVIVKGKLVPGIGGGICQVSSTLYNAVLRASELTIVERRNHSLPVNYLPQGMDATFAEGYINFRFRNDTGKRLLIKTAVQGRRLTVKLFGTMPENVRYELETVRERDIPPRIVYTGDAGVAAGMSRLVQAGKPGAVVDTYRLKYVSGKLTERHKLNRSVYRAQDAIVAVHPSDARARGEIE